MRLGKGSSSRHELNRMYTAQHTHTRTHTYRARHVHVCRHSIMLASSAVSLSHFICLGLRPRTCNLLIKYRMSFKQWWRLQRGVGWGHDILYHKSQLKMSFKLSLYTVYCHVAGTVSVFVSLSSLCYCRILTAFPTVILFSSALFFSHRHHYYHHYHADYPVC